MELDVLYTHIASPPVVTGLPALAQRIAHKELLHGADIIVGIHARLLKERFPLPPTPVPSVPPPPTFSLPPPVLSEDYELQLQPIAEPSSHTIEDELTEPPTSIGRWSGECGPVSSPYSIEPLLPHEPQVLPPAAEDSCYTSGNGFIEPGPSPTSFDQWGGGLKSGAGGGGGGGKKKKKR